MSLDVKSLYRVYEKNYSDLNSKIKNASESFTLLNDALIYSCLQNSFGNVDIGFTYDKFRENTKKYEIEMGTPIFFNKYKKQFDYEDVLFKAINSFNVILSVEKNFTLNAVEEILGNVLEQHINRKDTGSYYTPADTTEYMTRNAIFLSIVRGLDLDSQCKLMAGHCNKDILENKVDIYELLRNFCCHYSSKDLINAVNNLKIIDVTCGSGAFIIKAFNILSKIKKVIYQDNINQELVLQSNLASLHGLDNSKEAIILTKTRLILKVLSYGKMIKDFDKIFAHNFITADAYDGADYIINKPVSCKAFDWKKFGYKFDCIIGNPPYVETDGNNVVDFKTRSCRNLYAYTIERSCNIINKNGIISLIVPLSFITTPRMIPAKEYLTNCCKEVYFSTYADRPGCIFKGVHQRLTIFIGLVGQPQYDIYTTKYNYWYNDERENLYKNLIYYKNQDKSLPKIGSKIEQSILNKMEQTGITIKDFIGIGDEKLYLSSRIGFWTKCFLNKPQSKEFKELRCSNNETRDILNAFFNSSTFYYYWVIKSDCWHVSAKDYENIYFDIYKISPQKKKSICKLNKDLMEDLEKNKLYIGSKQVDYEYKHKYSKDIIDKIDDKFASMFEFTKEELDFVKNYTIKYRLNKAGEN